ncbi:TPA: hypothetical protein N0F65_009025 [Lagenidium giganteum]|uniref:Peptidase M48 domain-containing protein n=1 Tax=Lagenidium giganteum TaxID=4803 RepID=A0AAV2YS31_9STRA|nr:TPA: hypothetical protein N0F65_009025 [Lagenidium giganteum]
MATRWRSAQRRSLEVDLSTCSTVSCGAESVTGCVAEVFVASHAETVPWTGRRRLMFISPRMENAMGEQAFKEVMRTEKILPPTDPMAKAVARVGRKIAANSPGLPWQFHVIDEEEPNAFCIPGGRIFVHSGLFKILRNEDGLAAVLFHEAAHGLARHGAETISLSMFINGLLALLFPDNGYFSRLLVRLVVDLPYSRNLEMEADAIGLQLMAKACYDPRESAKMNEALGRLHQSEQLTKYVSTHPPSYERAEAIRMKLGDALAIFEEGNCHAKRAAFDQVVSTDNPQRQPPTDTTCDVR